MEGNFDNLLLGIKNRQITLQEFVRSILWGVVKDEPQRKISFHGLDFVDALGKIAKDDDKVRKIFAKFQVFFEKDGFGYYSDEISQQLANIEGLIFYLTGLERRYFVDDIENFLKVKKFFVANANLEIFEEIIEKTKKELL